VVYTIVMATYIITPKEIQEFKLLVQSKVYEVGVPAEIFRFTEGEAISVADFITIKKVMKHAGKNNARAAFYVALRLAAFPSKLSDYAKSALGKTPLKANGVDEIYYPISDTLMGKVVFTRAK
jgi:hypothetical protein